MSAWAFIRGICVYAIIIHIVPKSCGLSTLCILMDFPIHIDTVSMSLPIVYNKGTQVEYFLNYDVFLSLCCFSSGSSLFAKVTI